MEAVSPQDDGGMKSEEAIVESEMVDLDGCAGARKPMFVQDPKLPSQREREEHQMTHLPYRSWCSHCVRGKGKEAPHLRGVISLAGQRCTWTSCSWAMRLVERR